MSNQLFNKILNHSLEKKYSVILFLIFVISVFLSPAAVLLGAEKEKRIIINGKVLDLNTSNPQKDFLFLNIEEKLELAPFLIDQAFYSKSGKLNRNVVDFLQKGSHPLLIKYSEIAEIYFNHEVSLNREKAFNDLLKKTKSFTEVSLVRFHLALALKDNEKKFSFQDLLGICNLPNEKDSCSIIQFIARLNNLTGQKASITLHVHVMEQLRPYLTGAVRNPPFYLETAFHIPEQLYRMGFSLEAGILAGEMIRFRSTRRAYLLGSDIPFYLSTAGDFQTAAGIAKRNSRFKLPGYKNYLIDWMLFGGDYDGAAKEISETEPEVLVAGFYRGATPYWMDLPPAIAMQMKLALALHLAGDSKKAIEALEILAESGEKNRHGEPIKYYARLRLSQILMEANPILAQKIAEDVSYIAQEKDWAYLEYHATILDGWAQYFKKGYFYAVVSFIKAGGILPVAKRSAVDDTIRLLGLLAAYNKMNPRMNQNRLIHKIHSAIRKKPYNEAVSFIKYWSPVHLKDIFLREAVLNLNARGSSLKSLNYDLEFFRDHESYFQPGFNPGGIRGYTTTSFWSSEILSLPYSIHDNTLRRKIVNRIPSHIYPARYGGELQLKHLDRKTLYLFPVLTEEGARIYAVRNLYIRVRYYSKRKRKYKMAWRMVVHSISLDRSELERIQRKCSRRGSSCLKEGVKIRKILNGRYTGVRILYNPEFNVSLEHLFGKNQIISYFYSPYRSRQKASSLTWQQYSPTGCRLPSGFPGDHQMISAGKVFSGFTPIKGGILFFPIDMDRRKNSRGKIRPAYLRNFQCGLELYRLWDLDRFSKIYSPSLAVVPAESLDPEVGRVMARLISEKGGSVLEVPDWKKEEAAHFFAAARANGKYGKNQSLRIAVSAINKKYNSGLRIIFPSISD